MGSLVFCCLVIYYNLFFFFPDHRSAFPFSWMSPIEAFIIKLNISVSSWLTWMIFISLFICSCCYLLWSLTFHLFSQKTEYNKESQLLGIVSCISITIKYNTFFCTFYVVHLFWVQNLLNLTLDSTEPLEYVLCNQNMKTSHRTISIVILNYTDAQFNLGYKIHLRSWEK